MIGQIPIFRIPGKEECVLSVTVASKKKSPIGIIISFSRVRYTRSPRKGRQWWAPASRIESRRALPRQTSFIETALLFIWGVLGVPGKRGKWNNGSDFFQQQQAWNRIFPIVLSFDTSLKLIQDRLIMAKTVQSLRISQEAVRSLINREDNINLWKNSDKGGNSEEYHTERAMKIFCWRFSFCARTQGNTSTFRDVRMKMLSLHFSSLLPTRENEQTDSSSRLPQHHHHLPLSLQCNEPRTQRCTGSMLYPRLWLAKQIIMIHRSIDKRIHGNRGSTVTIQ